MTTNVFNTVTAYPKGRATRQRATIDQILADVWAGLSDRDPFDDLEALATEVARLRSGLVELSQYLPYGDPHDAAAKVWELRRDVGGEGR